MLFIDLPPKCVFTDRFGISRKLYGCSLIGRHEFFELIIQLAQLLGEAQEGESFQQLYDWNNQVQYLTDRLLELNGIKTDWVTLYQAEQLLLGADGEEAHLIAINKPKVLEEESPKKVDPSSLEEILASICTHFGTDVKGALELASKLPADFLLNLLEAKNILAAPPKEQAKAKMRKNKKQLKEQLKEVMLNPPTPSEEDVLTDGRSQNQTKT